MQWDTSFLEDFPLPSISSCSSLEIFEETNPNCFFQRFLCSLGFGKIMAWFNTLHTLIYCNYKNIFYWLFHLEIIADVLFLISLEEGLLCWLQVICLIIIIGIWPIVEELSQVGLIVETPPYYRPLLKKIIVLKYNSPIQWKWPLSTNGGITTHPASTCMSCFLTWVKLVCLDLTLITA